MNNHTFKIRNSTFLVVFIITACLNFTSSAKEQAIITTENLRAILPPPVARSTSVYGIIKNNGNTPDTLLNVSTDAGMIMLHKTDIKNGMAQMNHVNEVVIGTEKELILKPMSYHLMLMNINHDIIKEGNKISLTLTFKNAGLVVIKVPVLTE